MIVVPSDPATAAAVPDRSAPRSPDRKLSRSGKVWQALCAIWARDPSDVHITTGQLADAAGVSYCTAKRGLLDLARCGDLKIEADPDHPVGRRITPVAPPENPLPAGVFKIDPLISSDLIRPDQSYVSRDGIEFLHVNEGVIKTDYPPPSPSEPLLKVVARLDHDPFAVEAVVERLGVEYGREYAPFYRSACRQVVQGHLGVGELIGAVEEAAGGNIAKPGAAFIASVKRRRLRKPSKPATAPHHPGPEKPPEPPTAPVPTPRPTPLPALPAVAVAPPPRPPAPEFMVIPADREVQFHVDMLGSRDVPMRLAAIATLQEMGRQDLIERHRAMRGAEPTRKLKRPGRPR